MHWAHRTWGEASAGSSQPLTAVHEAWPPLLQPHAARAEAPQQQQPGSAGGGRERDPLRVRVHTRDRPAPRRPEHDAETERIAQIMASQRAQPWAHAGTSGEHPS
jgi:hypothetical protein